MFVKGGLAKRSGSLEAVVALTLALGFTSTPAFAAAHATHQTGLGVTLARQERAFESLDPSARGTWHTGEPAHGEHKVLGGGNLADYVLLGPSTDLTEVDVLIGQPGSDNEQRITNQAMILDAFANSFGGSKSVNWVGRELGHKGEQKIKVGKFLLTFSQVYSSINLIDLGVTRAP